LGAAGREEVTSLDKFVELRVKYPGHPYVALIDGLDKSFNLNRRWVGEQLYQRRERLGDGRQEQVYRLPLVDAIYEVGETINDRKVRRYVAVYRGVLQRLSRDAAESIAEGKMTLKQWHARVETLESQ